MKISIQGQREDADESILQDMRLREPVEELFRVGNMGMGFNESANQIVLVAYELVDEDDEPDVVSFWASRGQMKALVAHAREIVASGRPVCGNCGRPMDAGGAFLPKSQRPPPLSDSTMIATVKAEVIRVLTDGDDGD